MGRWGMGRLRLQIRILMGDNLILYVELFFGVKVADFPIDLANACVYSHQHKDTQTETMGVLTLSLFQLYVKPEAVLLSFLIRQ